LWLEADLDTDAERRTAVPRRVQVTEIRFPNLDAADAREWREIVASEFLSWKLTFSLDRLLSELKASKSARQPRRRSRRTSPDPLPLASRGAAGDRGRRRVARSAGDVLPAPREQRVLRGPGEGFGHLLPARHALLVDLEGTFRSLGPINDAPAVIAELWKSEPKPQLAASEDAQDASTRPEVIVVNQPAELVWTDGDCPVRAHRPHQPALREEHRERRLPRRLDPADLRAAVGPLVSLDGRQGRLGIRASDQLPLDFARIPLSSEKQHVLACVAGTAQARDAVRNATIPQTAAVQPGPAPDLAVRYDGEPQFTEVQESPVRYAVNTPYAVFGVYGRYYCCEEGIWYDSEYAVGPWSVCSWVPPAIYLIPPSCPFYYATYCRIFSVTPRAIYCGYYPGYRGCYVWAARWSTARAGDTAAGAGATGFRGR
jgi:hypothetical protein